LAQEDESYMGKLIQLIDYMAVSSLVTLAVSAAQQLHKQIVVSAGEHPRKLFYVSVCLRNTGSTGHVVVEPPSEVFEHVVNKLWKDITNVVDAVPQAGNSRRLARHAIQRHGQRVSEILANESSWRVCTDEIRGSLSAQLADLQCEAAKVYEPYRNIHEFGLSWDETSFAKKAHSYKTLSTTISKMLEFQEELSNIRIHRQVGVLLLDCRTLKDTLQPIPEKGLNAICPMMAALAREQILVSCTRAKHLIRELDKRPTEQLALEDFDSLVKAASTEQHSLQTRLEECLSMHRMLRQQSVRPPLDDQVMLDGFASKEHEFSQESLPAAMAYLAQQRRRAEVEISLREEMAFEVPATILVSLAR